MEEWNKKFTKIIDFYVFRCPVIKDGKRVSQKGKTFEELKITGTKVTALLKRIKDKIKAENHKWFPSLTNIETELAKRRDVGEYMYYIADDKLGTTKSIFYYIRCAFAHGDFEILSKRVYILRNCSKGVTRAIFRLNEQTLLDMIDMVENG